MNILGGLEFSHTKSHRLPPRRQTIASQAQHTRRPEEGSKCVRKDGFIPQNSPLLSIMPLEIRRMIWQYCLVVNVIEPFPLIRSCEDDHASVGLMRACRQTYAEGDDIFLTNVFQFWLPSSLRRFLDTGFHDEERRMRIQSVELGFRMVGMNDTEYLNMLHDADERRIDEDISGVLGDEPAGMPKHKHYLEKQVYRTSFWQPMTSLALEHFKPRRLYVDLTDCHDGHDCCSMQSTALLTLRNGFRDGHTPQVMKVWDCHGFEHREWEMNKADQLMLDMLRYWTMKRAVKEGQAVILVENETLAIAKEGEKALEKESQAELDRLDNEIWEYRL